jgi:hypothetical protein
MAASGPRVSASPLGNEAAAARSISAFAASGASVASLRQQKKPHPRQMAAAMG